MAFSPTASHCCELGRLTVMVPLHRILTCRARRIRALTQGSSYEASHRRRIIVRGHASRFVFVRGHGHLLHAYSFDRRVASIAGCGAVSNRWVPG
ncbi:hypothetical protein BHE74_00019667 [Ensete ventricosum]|nr:hypothetical protein BHE74_00019667 [Ensete ventricosum]RZR93974.1 hypothetical protein BHM03_00022571 [Ensete ventricosum]